MTNVKGFITQVIGPVVDVCFEQGGDALPKIHDALNVIRPNGQKLIIECQQHIGENSFRAIAMDSTDGLVRGMEVGSCSDFVNKMVLVLRSTCLTIYPAPVQEEACE